MIQAADRLERTDFKRIIDEARVVASEEEDLRQKIGLLALIASVSGLADDREIALGFVRTTSTQIQSELLATLATIFAEAGDYPTAREIVAEIRKEDAYWRVEALIHIGRFSNSKSDFDEADRIALHIRSAQLRAEALADIRLAKKEIVTPSTNGHHRHSDVRVQEKTLEKIVKTRAELKAYAMMPNGASSGHRRLVASSAILRGFAEAIK